MANEEHLSILQQGVEIWNQWREDSRYLLPDLNEADLGGADLSGAVLRGADLSGATLSRADLRKADLNKATLSHADLRGADLSGATLSRADLRKADLSDAVLSGANLYKAILYKADLSGVPFLEADLRGADLSNAILSGAALFEVDVSGAVLSGTVLQNAIFSRAILGNVDLSAVKGLETIRHQGPSTIGIDTIYRSQGKIPEAFLRGAGVPESFITYMHSLTGDAIQYYTCFISYSTKDQDFATRIHADLQAKSVRCWFAPHDIQGGKKIHEQIDQAIRLYDKLLVILSESSMASEWVKTEIYHARQQEVEENRRKLFPISLVDFDAIRQWKAFDADVGKDMAREVREYFIPDFSQWEQHSHYQKAFDRLLRDLKMKE